MKQTTLLVSLLTLTASTPAFAQHHRRGGSTTTSTTTTAPASTAPTTSAAPADTTATTTTTETSAAPADSTATTTTSTTTTTAPADATATATTTTTVATTETAPAVAVVETPHNDRGAFVIGVKAGGLFAQPFTQGRLGASFLVDVELGYVLPWANRSFGILLDVGYTQPTASGTNTTDQRVGATTPPAGSTNPMPGTYSYSLTQRELVTGLTLMYRMSFIANGRVAPYIGVGPRLFFLQTLVQGTGGTPTTSTISETREQSMRVGLSVPLGVDIGLGPGRVFIEALMLWAPIDHRITGDSSVGSIDALVGYRLWL